MKFSKRGCGVTRKEWKTKPKMRLFKPEFGLPFVMVDETPRLNGPCPCGKKKADGSPVKYKKCCLNGRQKPTGEVKTMTEQQFEAQKAMAGGE